MKPYLSVIIPAYNEEKRLPSTLLDIDKYLSAQKFKSEIIVVNDGSSDKTKEVVKHFVQLISNLKLIDNYENQGKGAVVRQGMMAAEGDYRLFMDADNSTILDHFDKIKPLLDEGYDVVIGSRDKKDAEGAAQAVKQPFLKRLLGNAGNILIQIFAVGGIWDTQCGFKCFSRKAVLDIFPKLTINRWALDVEILALAKKLKYNIAIIPVYWKNSPDSRVGINGYLITFRELFKIWWRIIRGKYKI